MERMTIRYSNGKIGIGDPLKYYNYEGIQKVLERLAEYEDTGMEPKEIVELKARMEGLCK